jgi:hypothetical protein
MAKTFTNNPSPTFFNVKVDETTVKFTDHNLLLVSGHTSYAG